jgi:signal transduction histidine kinase/streptogramin lyase
MSIFEDKTGMLWIGTEKGISKLYPNPKFKYYKRNPVESNTLSDDMISGIYVDKVGLLWVGTYNNGLNKIDRRTGKVEVYTADFKNETSLSNKSVWSIAEDKKTNLWLATNEGLNMLDKKTGKFTKYLHDPGNENSLIYDEVKYVYMDSRGLLWIGTRQGLDSLDVDNKIFTNYNELLTKNSVSDYFISYIFEDSKGILWLGTGLTGGLIRYDRDKNTMKVYKNNPKDINSISSNSIKCIVEDDYGNLWIATGYGVNKFNPGNETFTRYTEDEGLVNNYVYGVLIDGSNNPWISTNGGISKLNISTNEFINFNVIDGLQSNEFNARSFYKNVDGEMFFGGINGLNSFYPEQLSISENKADVVIKNFSIYEKAVSFKEKIKLKYNENYFSFQFFLTDYKKTSSNQYAYMLKGIDKDWVYASNRNYASYTNVSAGKYTFMVRGRNSNGKWSEPTGIDIEIGRAPWETGWAYSVYLLIVALVVYLIWNYVRILESLVQQRTSQLNNKLEENDILYIKLIGYERIKNNYFVNLSHELRTPLNVVLSTVQLVKKLNDDNSSIEAGKLDYYMGIVKRNSNRLLTVINNLIDTSKIDSGQYKINVNKVDIIYLVEETALSMKSYIGDNGLELIIDTDVEEKAVECDSIEIERCVVNLISNAVKFTPKGGTIWVTIYDKDDHIQISVKDNGIGIAKENQEKIFDRFGQIDNSVISTKAGSGIGLTLVKSLVEMHGGTIIVRSELNKGSEFIITLPTEYKVIEKHKD